MKVEKITKQCVTFDGNDVALIYRLICKQFGKRTIKTVMDCWGYYSNLFGAYNKALAGNAGRSSDMTFDETRALRNMLLQHVEDPPECSGDKERIWEIVDGLNAYIGEEV